MAFGFIKKVFSFGKKEVVEERPAEDAPLPPIDWKSLESLKEGEESVSSAPPETPVPQPTPEEPTPPPTPEKPAPAPTPEEPHHRRSRRNLLPSRHLPSRSRPRRLLLRLHPSPFLHLNLSPSLRLRLSR